MTAWYRVSDRTGGTFHVQATSEADAIYRARMAGWAGVLQSLKAEMVSA